jgi:acetolactate synthase-1/2/3 large subunit
VNGAESMLATAVRAGVELCFANPGTTEMGFVAALDRTPGLRAVLCLFEGVCTGAADGYARMLGRPAMTLLHLGPGFANGIANLHNARRAHSPVVNLVGDHMTWHLAADAPLTSDIGSLARPVSGRVATTRSARSAGRDIALAIAAAGRTPGLVSTLIVPADHQIEPGEGPAQAIVPGPARIAAPDRIDGAARAIRASRGPITLLLGGGALTNRGLGAAARIAAATSARLVAETFPARWERGGSLPSVERLPYLPEQASACLAADALLVLAGARSPVAFFGYPGQPSAIAPSVPRVPLAAPDEDSALALEQLADALDARHARATPPTAPRPSIEGPLDPLRLGAVLAKHLAEGMIVVDEAATSGLPFYLATNSAPAHSLLTLTGGAIGQGPPCATGAALACPDRPVIAFQADGSAMYTLQALWTQARESLHVITLLCSNRAYRILQIELARAGVAEPGPFARQLTSLEQPVIDWVALAQGLGVPGCRVETTQALDQALGRAIAARGPSLIEVVL